MKVILLKSVPKVGVKDQVVEVAAGFAQHALFPKKLAVLATPAALDTVARRKQNAVAEKEVRHHLLDQAIKELSGMELTMFVRANEQGNLFSKIHEADIAAYLLKEHRISIDPLTLKLGEGPIKSLGTHTIHVADDGYASDFTIKLAKQ